MANIKYHIIEKVNTKPWGFLVDSMISSMDDDCILICYNITIYDEVYSHNWGHLNSFIWVNVLDNVKDNIKTELNG
jgi:hypothetical protein